MTIADLESDLTDDRIEAARVATDKRMDATYGPGWDALSREESHAGEMMAYAYVAAYLEALTAEATR